MVMKINFKRKKENLYKNVDKGIYNIKQIKYNNERRIFLNFICYNKGKPIVMQGRKTRSLRQWQETM